MAYQILIIDDDREMVTLGRLILQREGFKVLSTTSGQEGLDLLEKESENVDLVLLDIMMLGMDGWQVLQKIKSNEKLAHIPVIMLTARHYLEDESETANYSALFNGYLVKPFVVKELLGKIRELIDQKEVS